MASFRKKGNTWEAQVAKLGTRKSASFFTKAEAQNWASRTEAAIVAGKSSGVADKTFGQLLERYRDEVTPTKRGSRPEGLRIGRFLRDPLAKIPLRELDTTHFAAWRDRRLQEVSAASVLRERNTLSNACKRAVDEWKWLPKHPMKGVTMPTKPQARDMRITPAEQDALAFQFGTDLGTVIGRVGQVFFFALETGMRAAEICNLRGPHLFLEKRYLVTKGKTEAATRNVPLSHKAVEILRKFTDDPELFRISAAQLDANWRKARDRALLTHLHFHDTRHEAITNLAQKLPLLDLARMVGHKNLAMLQVYYNATAEEIAGRLG